MSFGPLAFLNPWLLAALVTLPLIYWLLLAVPPRPTQIEFPPTRILVGIESEEKTAEKTPWWLTLLRLIAATLIILALADPMINPSKTNGLSGTGPVVIFVDNGWAAASRWPERATCIGLRLDAKDVLKLAAPCGLEDLFALRWRRNPRFADNATVLRRAEEKRVAARWPRVLIGD